MSAFDPRTVILARHAQHVVLIHFPIAAFITAVGFDCAAQWSKRPAMASAAYFNLLVAAVSTVPVIGTGLAAWRWALDGQPLKGVLLLHLALGIASSALILVSWWIHWRQRRRLAALPAYRLPLEAVGVLAVAFTGHLGGVLAGVS
jgi:uncharacterized membrane protein